MEGSLARALYTFQATQPDELSVHEGETIKVLHHINKHWLEAEYHGQRGRFPVSYTKWLEHESPSGNFASLSSSVQRSWAEQWLYDTAELSSYSGVKQSTVADGGGLFVEAAVGFNARNDAELTFPPGALIELTREVDNDWLEGSFNGKRGLFPKCYIKDSFQRPCARAVYPFVGESQGELTFREGERIFLRKRLNSQWMEGELDGNVGLFPSSFVAVEVDLPPNEHTMSGSAPKDANRNNAVSWRIQWKEGMRGRALFHFTALYDGDLELNEGDIVTVLLVDDDNWIKGQLENGITGCCPAAYLEPVGDNTAVPVLNNIQPQPYATTHTKFTNASPGFSERRSDFDANTNVLSFQSNERSSGGDFVDSWLPRTLLDSSLTEDLTPLLTPSNVVKPLIKPKPSLKPKPVGKHAVTYLGGENTRTPKHTSISMPLRWSDATVTAATSSVATSKGSSVRRDASQLSVGGPYSSESVGSLRGKRGGVDKEAAMLERNTSAGVQKTRSLADVSDLLSGTLTSLPSPLIPLPHGGRESQDGHSDSSEGGSPIAPRRPAPPPPRRNTAGADHGRSSNLSTPRPRVLVQHVSYGEDRSLLSTRGNRHPADDIMLNTNVREPLLRTPPYTTRNSLGSHQTKGRTNAKPKTLPRPTSRDWQEGTEERSNPRRCSSLEQLSTITTCGSELPVANSAVFSHSALSLNANTTDDSIAMDDVPELPKLEERIAEAEQNLKTEMKVFSGMKEISQFVMTDPAKQQEMDAKVSRSQQKINEWQEELKQLKGERAFLIESHRKKTLKVKIADLEADLEKQVRSQRNLETLLGVVGENRKEEIMDNLATCAQLVEKIKMKLTRLEASLRRLSEKPAASTQKHMAKQRQKVVSELRNTEEDYCNDLDLCVKYFLVELRDSKIKQLDCQGLFGNIENVFDISRKLLKSLEEACKDKDAKDQELGKCFVDLADEIKEVYAVYCRNHDDAIALMEKYEEIPEVQEVFTKCLDKIREHTRCWDLSSFLIKPVQRVLKYPLLLNEIFKYTPEIHRDKPNLLQAISVMTDVANAINEFKRRKDLVVKYKKMEDSGLTTMIQKLSWHSVLKKSSRFNQRLTQLTGLVSQTVDEKFNEEEKKFRATEKTVKTLWKNVVTYLEELQEATTCQQMSAENISDYYQEAGTCTEVSLYQRMQNMVRETVLNRFLDRVQRQVLLPLTSLLNLFQGPQRVIQKRHDKCLDYDSWSNKFDKIKDRDKLKTVKDELELAKKNYEALNTQLLEEIPGFTNKCMALVVNCLENFMLAQSALYDETQQEYKQLLQLSVVQTRDADIVEHHNQRLTQVVQQFSVLSFIPSWFAGKDSSRKMRRSPRHPALPSHNPNTPEDNGNDSSKTDFTEMREGGEPVRLSAKHLVPGPASKHDSPRPRPAPRRLATSTVPETRHTKTPQRVEVTPDEGEIHVVDFDFEAQNVGELSVSEGDRVSVLRPCDSSGNPEWWLVRGNGSTGYVPRSFLSAVDEPQDEDTANGHREDDGSGVGGDGTSSSGENDANVVRYYADFVFEANSAAEVNLDEGQVVTVLQKHDLLGNDEWWLVDAGGEKGYAPASYLTPVQE